MRLSGRRASMDCGTVFHAKRLISKRLAVDLKSVDRKVVPVRFRLEAPAQHAACRTKVRPASPRGFSICATSQFLKSLPHNAARHE